MTCSKIYTKDEVVITFKEELLNLFHRGDEFEVYGINGSTAKACFTMGHHYSVVHLVCVNSVVACVYSEFTSPAFYWFYNISCLKKAAGVVILCIFCTFCEFVHGGVLGKKGFEGFFVVFGFFLSAFALLAFDVFADEFIVADAVSYGAIPAVDGVAGGVSVFSGGLE